MTCQHDITGQICHAKRLIGYRIVGSPLKRLAWYLSKVYMYIYGKSVQQVYSTHACMHTHKYMCYNGNNENLH